MLCRKSSKNGVASGSVPVYLNVYDLTPMNGYAYWFGLGVYHSGVQGSSFFFLSLTHSPPLLNLRKNPPQIYDPQPKKVSGSLSFPLILTKIEFFILRCSGTVHGVEFAFGAHEYPSTGIFEGEPKRCEGFTFRKTILIGKTDMGPGEVKAVMEELAAEYRGNAYNLITKNCNHFCNAACLRLTGNPIPSWVNRLARIGKW